jgi:DNA transposition AAA+ family ATPase
MNEATPFLVTSEYRRFAEFCDACRHYRYIGLCYGPPGVGKTLSARHYADWDRFEALPLVWHVDDEALAVFASADTVLYTPEIVNSPSTVSHGVRSLCTSLDSIQQEPRHRAERTATQARAREEERRSRELLLEGDWFAPRKDEPVPQSFAVPVVSRRPSLSPVRLILVDEADRLKVPSLEQLRDLFDRNEFGLVLIGMPGIEKRLARYPQLYSRVGFVHAFRTLRAEEIRQLLVEHGPEIGLTPPTSDISDQEAIAAIIRITGGNFRLLRRLLSQIERILGINQLQAVTATVVEAARETGATHESHSGSVMGRALPVRSWNM